MGTTTFTPDNLIAGDYPIKTNQVTILANEGALVRGTGLGKITKGDIAIAALAANTGKGAAGAITIGAKAIVGAYSLVCIAAATGLGTFAVYDPDGKRLADLTVGTAYDNGHFAVTIADGDPDFIVGDKFTVTVAAGSGKFRKANSANKDGSGSAICLLAEAVAASTSDVLNVPIYETGEFAETSVVFGGSDTATTHRDSLRSRSIFLVTVSSQT